MTFFLDMGKVWGLCTGKIVFFCVCSKLNCLYCVLFVALRSIFLLQCSVDVDFNICFVFPVIFILLIVYKFYLHLSVLKICARRYPFWKRRALYWKILSSLSYGLIYFSLYLIILSIVGSLGLFLKQVKLIKRCLCNFEGSIWHFERWNIWNTFTILAI